MAILAKGSPSQLKRAKALKDNDDDVYNMLVGKGLVKYPFVRTDTDFFTGYLASDCTTVAIPSLGGKF